jgi:hypothetical protein
LPRGEQTYKRARGVADKMHLSEAKLLDERHQVFYVSLEYIVDPVADGKVRMCEPAAVVDDAKMLGEERFKLLPRTQVADVRVDEHHRVAMTVLSVCE